MMRRLAAIATLVVVGALWPIPGMASAARPPLRAPVSRMTVAQAPTALRAAIQSALGLQKAALTPSDPAPGDSFGFSVAVSGSTAVVGAHLKSSSKGAAYVFVRSGTIWSQQAELTAAGGAPNDHFGFSVAVFGSTAVVGAPGTTSSTGAAYVFVLSGATWSQQAMLTASDGVSGDAFAISVAISDTTVLVGAANRSSATGAAYMFFRSGTTWSQQAELTASDGAPGDSFGVSVALSGSTAIVGASRKGTGTGAAYVFVRSGPYWFQQARLAPPGSVVGRGFGYSVAVSTDSALVGVYPTSGVKGVAYVFVRSAATWSLQAKLAAGDGRSGDFFGSSVALSGSTALVGAYGLSSHAGAAYLLVRSGTKWVQEAKLTASGGASNDLFGASVAISNSVAVVGAYGKSSNAGAAYVDGVPVQQAKLTGTDIVAGEYLARSVAISGTTAVVGSYYHSSGTGAAYVFVRVGTTWFQQAELTAYDGVAGGFGYSVAISGTTAIVGAPGRNANTGGAYVFVRSGTIWQPQSVLTASNGAPNDEFGGSVALDGSTAVVGAPYANSNAGEAYAFVRSGTTWSQEAQLIPADGAAAGDYYGWSVAVSSTTAVVGVPYKNGAIGSAYVFVQSGTVWSQQAQLTATDAATNDLFGYSVAISGSTLAVGAYFKNSGAGAAYVFVRAGTAWSQQAHLTALDGAPNDIFGFAVAISGSTVIVGAAYKSLDTGAAYVFAQTGTTWSQQARLVASDGAAAEFYGSSVAISGSTAVVGGPGDAGNTGAAYVYLLP
jgi:hypothetical protein